MKDHAVAVFHRMPENLNCAQAVLDAWQVRTGERAIAVESWRAFGGGRAPDGECGALWAACQLRPEAGEGMRAGFAGAAGALDCRSLKRDLKVSCPECVGLAAGLLDAAAKA